MNDVNEDMENHSKKENDNSSHVLPENIDIGEKVSVYLKGEELIRFKMISERIVFNEKMTQKTKNAEIVKIAIDFLESQIMKKVGPGTGRSFISIDSLKSELSKNEKNV